ncbi:glycosyltransferase [Chitinophagaceae bacterium LWZ2-11]
MIKKINIPRVLIAPLDWGLGHTTRCIPLINAFITNGFEVFVACNFVQRSLLEKEFRNITFLELPGYEITYSRKKSALIFKLIGQLPKIIRRIGFERQWLKEKIGEYGFTIIVSDNRFGLYNRTVPSIFITHQLTIKAPVAFVELLLQKVNYKYINRFTTCWVPDLEGNKNIAGILSHPNKLPNVPVEYMGLLSRFTHIDSIEKKYDYCISLSGPEPQRTILEQKILEEINKVEGTILLVRGKPNETTIFSAPVHVEVCNHLPGPALAQAFLQSNYIISRTGYTTVMELLALQCKSILIPTPGQTEQEYLLERLKAQGWCYGIDQSEFSLLQTIEEAKRFTYTLPDRVELFNAQKLQQLLQKVGPKTV